jgi:hypothetical protein
VCRQHSSNPGPLFLVDPRSRCHADVRSRQRSGRHFPAVTRRNRSKPHDPIQGHSASRRKN